MSTIHIESLNLRLGGCSEAAARELATELGPALAQALAARAVALPAAGTHIETLEAGSVTAGRSHDSISASHIAGGIVAALLAPSGSGKGGET